MRDLTLEEAAKRLSKLPNVGSIYLGKRIRGVEGTFSYIYEGCVFTPDSNSIRAHAFSMGLPSLRDVVDYLTKKLKESENG